MITALNISRILVYVMILGMFIVSIKTKSKRISKNNLILSFLFIIYLFLSISFIPDSMGIDLGWSTLLHALFIGIAFIVSVISIIFNIKKIKNITEESLNENLFIKFYYLIFILIPIVIVFGYSFYEKSLINNADIFLEFGYDEGIINHETFRYVAKNNSFKEVDMNYTVRSNSSKLFNDVYYYDLRVDDNKNFIIENKYTDPELKNIDVSVAKNIYYDNNYKLNEEVVKKQNDAVSIRMATLMKIVGTDYYIIEHHISDGKELLGSDTLLGAALFKSNEFITDVDIHGDFQFAVIYK